MAMDGTAYPAKTRQAPLMCFSHLRWESVFQRPHHLMARFARVRDVYYFEEPEEGDTATLRFAFCEMTGVRVVTPVLPRDAGVPALRTLLDRLMARIEPATAWYYTPMARGFSDHIAWRAIAFDVMDELSAFRFAPPAITRLEAELMRVADVVFTGGASLHSARAHRHANIHCLPSGVDLAHFMTARDTLPEPLDQARLPRPLLGYFGVIDERLDMPLLAAMAAARPDWHFAMIGPVAKLTPEELPQAPNLHWLGARPYEQLPAYLAQWDVALMPFAINEATRFISPTKAPEYLAGGKRVISTPIADVVSRYAGLTSVVIAEDAQRFIAGAAAAMADPDVSDFVAVDDLLATLSWDMIHERMARLLAVREDARLAAPAAHSRPARIADHLVVGAGFAGAITAERLAANGRRVLLVDRRPHLGGNAFDEHDAAGILVHRYGPHIFHTNSDEVLAYLSRFTAWRPYQHRVLASVEAGLVPMPINRTTLSSVFSRALATDEDATRLLEELAEPMSSIVSARDFVIASVGQRLYEMFFRGYTVKQWGVDPSQLDRSVTARVPTRVCDDDRYFQDRHQCMPLHGYTRMFENIVDHPNITVITGTDFADLPRARFAHTVFTGPIDSYFDQRFGPLPYRSLRFEHETRAVEFVQPVATINYPGMETPYTRCTEFKHITGQVHAQTSLCRELSSAEGEPYYPVPNPANQQLYKRYEALADAETGVTFLGRLGAYRYMNMDQVVAQALVVSRRLVQKSVVQVAAE